MTLSVLTAETDPRRSVVVLPDFGKDGLPTEQSCDWIQSLIPQDGTTVQILRFDYRIRFNSNTSVWRQLSGKGEDLLNILYRESSTYEVNDQARLRFFCG